MKSNDKKLSTVSRENESIKNIAEFEEITTIIDRSREKVFRSINRELIDMYWEIGKHISKKVKTGKWGKSVVKEFADFIQLHYEGIKGFSKQNLWRMKQFYETYAGNEKLSPLVREISWTNNLLIMMSAKSDEDREFYLLLCNRNNYSKRELERQMNSRLFERTIISGEINKDIIARNSGLSAFRDSYILEFLDIPEQYKEKELRKAILANMKNFILEFGKNFSFVGEEYRVQVGNSDFNIDLLFYNRELSCLVAIELKTGKFQPSNLGQLEFYLEAPDRDVKKPNENPSVGLILCTEKDDEVVEYALSRSMSPAMIAEYQTYLPQKALLENKLRELRELAEADGLAEGNDGGDEE